MSISKPLRLTFLFIVHILTGIVLFVLIAAAAVAVHYVGQQLGGDGLSYYVLTGFNCLSLFLFAADFISVVLFVGVQTVLFGKDLVKYSKKAWTEE